MIPDRRRVTPTPTMTDHDPFPDALTTDRLRLAALTAETVDTLDYYRVVSGRADEEFERVTRYLPWDPHDHPKETHEFLSGLAERRAAGENAEFVVRPREGTDGRASAGGAAGRRADADGTEEFAGVVGLGIDPDRRTGELGIWLREPFQGRGYAGEACRALARVAFERLALDLVVAVVRADNGASNRAFERFATDLGGRREGRLRNGWRSAADDRPHDAVRYSVTRQEWARTRERSGSQRAGIGRENT